MLFNTGSGFKYTDMSAEAMGLHKPEGELALPGRMAVGGIITPQ